MTCGTNKRATVYSVVSVGGLCFNPQVLACAAGAVQIAGPGRRWRRWTTVPRINKTINGLINLMVDIRLRVFSYWPRLPPSAEEVARHSAATFVWGIQDKAKKYLFHHWRDTLPSELQCHFQYTHAHSFAEVYHSSREQLSHFHRHGVDYQQVLSKSILPSEVQKSQG